MHLLWLDLETTGLDEKKDQILEIAAVVTDTNLRELTRFEALVYHAGAIDPRDRADDYVVRMHEKSGLWAAWELAMETGAAIDIRGLDAKLYVWLADFCDAQGMGTSDSQFTLAGSGVATFDLRWLKELMPFTATALTYFTIDTGVLRRFLRDLSGIHNDPDGAHLEVAHRSMADVEQNLRFARLWAHRFEGAFGHGDLDGAVGGEG